MCAFPPIYVKFAKNENDCRFTIYNILLHLLQFVLCDLFGLKNLIKTQLARAQMIGRLLLEWRTQQALE